MFLLGALLGKVRYPRLADHRDLDLPWVTQVRLDFLYYVPAEHDRIVVRYFFVFDKDADLAAGLDGVAFVNTLEGIGNALQFLKPLDVGLQHLPPGPGPRCRQGVGGLDEDPQKRVAAAVIVVRRDGL